MTSPRGMLPPETLLQNRYRILGQIGEGGMGAVYVATDERFGSTVALKETFFRDPSLRRAFEREAQLLNRLRHPALPKVSDHFAEADGQFLVMEFIAGDDLSEMLDRRGGPFPVEDVLRWADDLLDALDYLHTQEPSIVHRDIKPQNLKLTPRGHVVLLDFGLAKGSPAQTSQATKSVFGYSRNYAPLEQIQGTGTDTRSDIYSLGATLYHLLTARVPQDALTRAMAVLNGQPDPLPPVEQVNPQVSAGLGAVLARAMSQTAAARQQSAAELREDLRRAAAGEWPAGAPATAATLVTPPAPAAHATRAASEQETRIFGAREQRTNADGRDARETVRAGAPDAWGETTRVGGGAAGSASAAGDAPTRVMHGARATEAFGTSSATSGASSDPRAASINSRDAGDQTVVARRRGRAGLVAATAVGLVALCGGAFGLYQYARRPAASDARPAAEATHSPGASTAPAAAAPPTSTHGAAVAPGANQNTAPGLVEPAQPAQPSAAERRAARGRASGRAADAEPGGAGASGGVSVGDEFGAGRMENFNFNFNGRIPRLPPGARGGRTVVVPPNIVPPNIDWEKLTPAERERLIRRIRSEVMRENQRALEEMRRHQQRQRQRAPAPPPPRPVPTRTPER